MHWKYMSSFANRVIDIEYLVSFIILSFIIDESLENNNIIYITYLKDFYEILLSTSTLKEWKFYWYGTNNSWIEYFCALCIDCFSQYIIF